MIENYNKKDSYKWIILAISFLLTFTFAISLQALPPIFESMIEEIPFSNSQAGFLMSAYSILGILIPFTVAFFIKKFNIKKLIISSLLLVIMGLIGFALSSSYTLLLIFRLISGAGSTILVVLSPLLITMFFKQKNIGIAMGIFNTAVPTGTVVSANLFGYLALSMNWKTIIIGIAAFATIILAIVLLLLYIPKGQKSDDVSSSKLQFNMGVSLWLLAIIWMIANAQLLAYTTFGSQFFQLSNISVQRSGLLTSLIMFVSIFLTPIIGFIIDKINRKRLFLVIGNIIMAVSFFLITTSLLSLSFWAVALGIGFSLVPVCIFSLLPDVVKPEQMSIGLAVITAASNLGIAVGPSGFGSLLDKTSQNFIFGFILLSILSLIGILVSLGVKSK